MDWQKYKMVDNRRLDVDASTNDGGKQPKKQSCSHQRRHYTSSDEMLEVSRLFIFYGFLMHKEEFYIITVLP